MFEFTTTATDGSSPIELVNRDSAGASRNFHSDKDHGTDNEIDYQAPILREPGVPNDQRKMRPEQIVDRIARQYREECVQKIS